MKYENTVISSPNQLLDFLQKTKQQKQYRQTLELAITICVVCFFLFFAIRPTVFTISDLVGDIKSKKDLTGKLKLKINSVIQAQTVFGELQSDYQLINSSLPDSYNFTHTANQIKAIGQRSGLSINQIDFGLDQKEGQDIPSYSYQIHEQVSFDKLTELLSGYSQNRRCLQLTGFSLSPQVTPDGQPVSTDLINVSISTNFFYWPNEH